MAVFYFCNNEKCERMGHKIPSGKVRFTLKGEKLVPEIRKCLVCDKEMSYEEVIEEGPININIGDFKGKTVEDKAKIMKKRMQHYNKKDCVEDRKAFFRKKVTKDFFGE